MCVCVCVCTHAHTCVYLLSFKALGMFITVIVTNDCSSILHDLDMRTPESKTNHNGQQVITRYLGMCREIREGCISTRMSFSSKRNWRDA